MHPNSSLSVGARNLPRFTPQVRAQATKEIERIQTLTEKLAPLEESLNQLRKSQKTLSDLVGKFIPHEYNDELKEKWKKIAKHSSLIPVDETNLKRIEENIRDTRASLDKKTEEFRTLSLEAKEIEDGTPSSLPLELAEQIALLKRDLFQTISDLESNIFTAKMGAMALLYINQRKRSLPYSLNVDSEAKKAYDRNKAEIEQWFSSRGSLPEAGSIPESEFSPFLEKLRALAGIENVMLENQLEMAFSMAELKREKGSEFEKLSTAAQLGTTAPDTSTGNERVLVSSFDSLIGNALSAQTKYAHFSLLGERAENAASDQKKGGLPQQLQDIGNTLFRKADRFTTGFQDFFANQLDKHKPEETVLRIRSFERRAQFLARQYGGFAGMLEQGGFAEHAPAFRKLEERFNDVMVLTRSELEKRGATEAVDKMKKKSRPTIEHKLRTQTKQKDARASGAAPVKDESATSTSTETKLAPPAEDDEDIKGTLTHAAEGSASTTRALSPTEIAMRRKEVRGLLDDCLQGLDKTRKQLYVPLEDKIRAYVRKHTVEPQTTQELDRLDKNLQAIQRLPAAKRPQALLEHWGQGMVTNLVKEEVEGIFQHKLLTEQAVQHLAELKSLPRTADDDKEKALPKNIDNLEEQDRALARDIAENCVYPSEDTLFILLEQGVVSVGQTGEGLPYYWRSGTDRGDRGLIDVFSVKKKNDGTLWAELHRHYDGNPETKKPYLIPATQQKRVTVVTVKHPDVCMRGREYIRKTLQKEGVQKAVHRTTMNENSLQLALEVSQDA